MTTASAQHETRPASFRRTLTGSMVGAVLEWYDFAIYGALAATVFAVQYFPQADERAGLLLAFGTQAVGFAARPLGGIFFGAMADRSGRKPALIATFVLLGVTTGLIGLLPSYASVGIAAPLLLVLLRFTQGFALGGEFGAAIALVSEHSTPRNRGFWVSIPQTGGPAGTLVGTAVLGVIAAATTQTQFDTWGWRVAFLLAIPLLLVGAWLRRSVEESPAFREMQHEAGGGTGAESAQRGLGPVAALTHSPRALLQGFGVRTGENVAFYVYSIFTIAYATKVVGFETSQALLAVTCGAAIQLVAMLLGGYLSDRVGRRPVMITAALGLALWAPVYFSFVQEQSVPLLHLAVYGGMLFHGLLAGPEAAWVSEIFPTAYRTSGMSLAVQGSSIVGGGPAPLIATALLGAQGETGLVVAYLVVAAGLSAVCALWGPETRGIDLTETTADRVAA